MIPKIAHFHWTGPPMSWLRMVSIATFRKQNPGWEIRLHDTPEDIRKYELTYQQEADWTWWVKLYGAGGLQVATDTVFVNPIPDEWLEHDYAACFNGRPYVIHNAVFGAKQAGVLVQLFESKCFAMAERGKVSDTQAFGPSLLQDPKWDYGKYDFVDVPFPVFLPVAWHDAEWYWRTEDPGIVVPHDIIGYHWYGGDKSNREFEAGPDSPYVICKLAREALA